MNNISIGTTYYNNPSYLLRFIERNIEYVDEMIIVDDGSQINIETVIPFHEKLKLYKVKKDYGFNSHGCRNLIVKESSYEFIVLIDVDREFLYPKETFDLIRKKTLKKDTLYRFIAHSNMDESHISVNDFLISKTHFFSAGGYDEEIIGERWGDREYFKQLLHFGKEEVLYGVDLLLTRKPSNIIKGNTKSKLDKMMSKEGIEIVQKRIKCPEPNKPILTFEWVKLV